MLNKTLEKRQSFDPRPMMGGTSVSLCTAIKNAIHSPGIFLHSIMPHPLNYNSRNQVTNILKEQNHPDNALMMLLSPFGIFSLVKPKKREVVPDDLLLIMNLIHSSQALRTSESWVPICLPGISADGFVYAYIYFYTKNVGIVIITDVTTSEMFYELKERAKIVFENLTNTKLIDALNNSLLTLPISEDIAGVKGLRHFLIKNANSYQYTMSKFLPYGSKSKETKKYTQIFSSLYERYLECHHNKKNFFYIEHKEDGYYCLGTNDDFQVFMDFNQYEPMDRINQAFKDIFKWIKAEENQYFIKIQ